MKTLIKKINLKLELILFLLLIFGLSYSILLKELNLLFFDFFNFKIIYLYRGLIVLMSLVVFYKMKKKFNVWVFLILIINIQFIYNFLYGDLIFFKTESLNYFDKFNYHFNEKSEENILYSQKNKFLIINILNITLPLFVLSFMKRINMKVAEFKAISKFICEVYTICLFLLIVFKLSESFFNYKDVESLKIILINPHGMLYILNIHFLLILDQYLNQYAKLNKKDYLALVLIFLLFFVTESMLHVLICFLTLIVFFVIKKKIDIKFMLITIIFFLFILMLVGFNYILTEFNFYEPGSYIGSANIRAITILYFLNETINLNILFGNNIFSKTLVTYPHNIFIDLMICVGFIGLIVFMLVNIKLLFYLFKIDTPEILVFYLIFFQSFIFSNFSGFLFINIILNTSLAICFIIFKSNEDIIRKNSLG